VERRLAAQADDVERFAARHRFTIGSVTPSDVSDSLADGAAAVNGFAPRELEAAAAALRTAYARRDRAAVIERLADLAIAATDLADPFQVVGLDHDEVPGARAAFSDLIVGVLPAALDARATTHIADPLSCAVALAEEAVALGEWARLDVLRRQRLEAALGLAQAIAYGAWRAAGELVIGSDGSNTVHTWPNPVRAEAQIRFAVPTAGQATVDLFDLGGRRVWSKPLGQLAAGQHTASLPVGAMRALPPGVYLVRLKAPRYEATGRLTYQAR
jgi:hypothetical protein